MGAETLSTSSTYTFSSPFQMSPEYEIYDESGYTSKVYLLSSDPGKVCKSFNPDCRSRHFPAEKAAYERFFQAPNSPPPSILRYYGIHPTIPAGVILSIASEGNLWDYFYDPDQPTPTPAHLRCWAHQASSALEFAHNLGVLHSDIHVVNFFLDANHDLKVGDWAGASIDGKPPACTYREKYRLHDEEGHDVVGKNGISMPTELFALGSALYHLELGHEVWPELKEAKDDDEIKRRLCAREFPDMGADAVPVLGSVVKGCWMGTFKSMQDVRLAVETLQREHGDELG